MERSKKTLLTGIITAFIVVLELGPVCAYIIPSEANPRPNWGGAFTVINIILLAAAIGYFVFMRKR